MKLADAEGGGVFEAGHVGEHHTVAGADTALHLDKLVVGTAELHLALLQLLAVVAHEEEAVGAGAGVIGSVGDAGGLVHYVAGYVDVGLQPRAEAWMCVVFKADCKLDDSVLRLRREV